MSIMCISYPSASEYYSWNNFNSKGKSTNITEERKVGQSSDKLEAKYNGALITQESYKNKTGQESSLTKPT